MRLLLRYTSRNTMEKQTSTKQSVRIQTSILNGVEKKALLWLAERQPKWTDSDMLTFIGFIGAVIIAVGYILSNCNVHFLWLASLGFIINWYGDSLDLSTVNDDTQLVSDLGLDSLTILLLGLAIENKFGSQVNIMKGALEFQTVGDVIDFIMQAKS